MPSRTPRPEAPSSADIRRRFLEFFEARGHTIVPSASLVPANDPTLLFTNAGMVQFKDVFLGTGKRPYTRVVDSQKCLRVAGKHNDLDDVGRDDSHHTFFEMLGNWSFGDYYKKDAIAWAWELLTGVWGLPKAQLYATCFEDEQGEIPRDDEAAGIWAAQPGFDPAHILFFGRKENFWEMADTGPSGPDSEIHIDRGTAYCNMQDVPGHECRINGECARFLELWNLVFIQYNRTGPKELEPLPAKHVDTGMGFERIVSVLQDVDSNYKTDLFQPLFNRIQELGGHTDEERQALLTPYRVISDHARAAAFLIGDGVVPGNTGRNYVCRMIIRRGSRFGNKAGFEAPFLAEIADVVIEKYGEVYSELRRNRDAILRAVTDEERRFQHTVDSAVAHLGQRLSELAAQGQSTLSGEVAFDLYATYGLPFEITRDIARDEGLQVDEEGFHMAMEAHRQVSGQEQAFTEAEGSEAEVYRNLLEDLQGAGELGPEGVVYNPYGSLKAEGKVLAILKDGTPQESAGEGESVGVVLPETPFYVEAGGQVSDTGGIASAGVRGWEFRVEDTRRPVSGIVVHYGRVKHGMMRVGDRASAEVDRDRRADIMRNHTATHLLHAALREVLGHHARQAGSLVAPDRLRFDFTHSEALTDADLRDVERRVNEAILSDYALEIRHQPREEAIAEGAMALFGETYGEVVRSVRIGGEHTLSYELCGGTHVARTGGIGPFLIVSEGSVAAGIRRIEALTGRAALGLISDRLEGLTRLAGTLAVPPEGVEARVERLLEERDRLAAQVAGMRQHAARAAFQELAPTAVDGVPVLTGQIPEVGSDVLRTLVDEFRGRHPSGVVVLASAPEGKPVLVAGVSQDLVARGLHAGELVKEVAKAVGGGGGGKPTLAQAGGNDASKLPGALELVQPWVESHLR